MLTRLAAASVLLGALTGTALAQKAARGLGACRTDTATFCSSVEAGRGKRVACLAANKDKLSPDCAAALQQRLAQTKGAASPPAPSAPGVAPPVASAPGTPAAPNAAPGGTPGSAETAPVPQVRGGKAGKGRFVACRADLKALCTGVPAGGGAKHRCLEQNQASLSAACAQTLIDAKTARKAAHAACATDGNALCPGLKGDARRACLVENQSKLSPACAGSIAKQASRAQPVR